MSGVRTHENPLLSDDPNTRVAWGIKVGKELFKKDEGKIRFLKELAYPGNLELLTWSTLNRVTRPTQLIDGEAVWAPTNKADFGFLRAGSPIKGIVRITGEHKSQGLEWQAHLKGGLTHEEQNALRNVFSPDAYPDYFVRFFIVNPEMLPQGESDTVKVAKLAEVIWAGKEVPKLEPEGFRALIRRWQGDSATFSGRKEGDNLYSVNIKQRGKPASIQYYRELLLGRYENIPFLLIGRVAQTAKTT